MSSGQGDNADEKKQQTVRKGSVPQTRIEFVALAEKPPKGKPRYRDPENPFQTWSGRGKRPGWLRDYLSQGRRLEEFAISEEE